jgi:methyl-accepting chemotaxis protein|nr:MAG TPA: tail tape measure [Caudoviricetes sp.]
MAAPSINSKIKLDGEREYKAALAEIKSGLNVLKSELNLASEQFRDNADSVEALTKKNDILDRTILTQKEKIEQIEKALQSSASAYGEADERTNRWKTQLNNAQAELVKMERALKDNEDALQKAQKETDGTTTAFGKLKKALSDTKEQGGGIKGLFANLKEEFSGNDEVVRGLGDALTDVAGKFGIQLPEGAQKAVESLNGIHAGAALAVTGLGLVVAAVVKTEKALISMTKKSAEYAKEIKTFSSVTGQSVESLQEFDYAAEMIGVSSDRIRDSLKETTNKMQEARDGNEATAAAYAKLGVSITDANGNLRSAEDVFYDTIDALGQMENRTERDALAMDLMSESAQELNPLIDAGSGALKKYADEAHDMGYVLDNEALTALTEVDDAYQRLQKSQESAKNQLSAEFAPYLTEFYEKITKLIKDGGQAMKESGLVDSFGMLLETVGNIIAPTDDLANGAVPNLTKALRPLSEVIALIADTLQVISGLVTLATTPLWHFDKWASGFTKIGTGLGMNKNQPSNQQRLWAQWEGADTNAATNAAGYGAYYANGKYYGNRDAYLREQWESELNAGGVVGSFEAWKQAMGYTRNASGTDWFPGGRTLLSEHGAETAILPQGTRILTAQETRQTGGDTYNITIDAHTVREFEDILRIVQERRRVVRMGGATG